MTHLVACILALSVLRTAPSGPVYSKQLRSEGAEARATYLGRSIDDVARLNGLDDLLVLSIAWFEAAFARQRVSSKGARSMTQLKGRMGHAYDKACEMVAHPWECDRLALAIMARELRRGLAECGTEAGAVSWYRIGDCSLVDDWRVQAVLALRDELEWSAP